MGTSEQPKLIQSEKEIHPSTRQSHEPHTPQALQAPLTYVRQKRKSLRKGTTTSLFEQEGEDGGLYKRRKKASPPWYPNANEKSGVATQVQNGRLRDSFKRASSLKSKHFFRDKDQTHDGAHENFTLNPPCPRRTRQEKPSSEASIVGENTDHTSNPLFPFNKQENELTDIEKDTNKLFPIPLLWNKTESQPGPRFISITDLILFLRVDRDCVMYVGQEFTHYRKVIFENLSVRGEYKSIDKCLKTTGVDQRIPILNPKRTLRFDPPETWPCIMDYQDYVLREHREQLKLIDTAGCYRISSRRRLFCAGETCTLGIGPHRVRFFSMNKKGVCSIFKRGKKKVPSELDVTRVLKDEGSGESKTVAVAKRKSLFGTISKGNSQTQKLGSKVPPRSKRKRRPNVLYFDKATDETVLGDDARHEDVTGYETSASPVAQSNQNRSSDVLPTKDVHDRTESLVDDFLGTNSIENEVETPDYLWKVSQFIDYVPGDDICMSSTHSSLPEDEPIQNCNENLSFVDNLDKVDVEDSRDPLFAEVDDNVLRMLDVKASEELLTKRVLEEQAFDPDTQLFGDNLQKSHEETKEHFSGFTTKTIQEQSNAEDHVDKHKMEESEGSHVPKGNISTFNNSPDFNAETASSKFQPYSATLEKLPGVGDGSEETNKRARPSEGLLRSGHASHDEPYSPASQIDFRGEKSPTEVQDNISNQKSLPNEENLFLMSDVEAERSTKPRGTSPSPEGQVVKGVQDDEMKTMGHTKENTKEPCLESPYLTKALPAFSIVRGVPKKSDSDAFHSNVSGTFQGANGKNASICDSIFVYLWDHRRVSREERVIPLRAAISRCMESDVFSIYDGQDFDFKDRRTLVLTGMTDKDMAGWRNRETQTGKIRKLRIWNSEKGGLRTHYRSPALQRLTGWFESNPENIIFSPSLVLPSSIRGSGGKSEKDLSSVWGNDSQAQKSSLWKHVEALIMKRTRDLRVMEITKKNLSSLDLWNTTRKRIEPGRSFTSHATLIRFLFAYPWLEPLCGQDKHFQLESSTSNKLIWIRLSCDSSVARYWDSVEQKVYTHSNEICEHGTVGDFLASNTRLVLYQGQDLPYFHSLVSYYGYTRFHGYPVLIRCGAEIQEAFFARRWVTVVVDPVSCSTACAVFWNKESKTVHMQPEICRPMTINSYMQEHPCMELYGGQDRSESVQQEIADWMKLLKKCSPRGTGSVILLTRVEFVPLKYNPVAWLDSLTDLGIQSIHHRKVLSKPSTGLPNENQKSRLREKVMNTDVHFDQIPFPCTERRKREAFSSEIHDGKCRSRHIESDDHCPGKANTGSSHDSIIQATDETIVLEPSTCTSIGSDDLLSEDGTMCPELEGISQNFEERLRAPARAAARLLTNIKEVGPRILKQELVHDLRHALYENTTMEVGSVPELHTLLQQTNNLYFVHMAAELCNMLESIDVTGCFTGNADIGYGANDVLSVREDLQSGKICMMSDVVKRFRIVCQNLVDLNEGFYLELEARELMDQGEAVIQLFMKENEQLFTRELKIRRLAKICDRARQIGFRKQRNRNVFNEPPASGNKNHDVTIRASNGHTRVTFLNYRDEKGNSVMGKRTSVRVFGLPIDTKACQRDDGGARPCHVCGHEVFEADENSLTCGNRFFGGCNESVCQQCLETVTCMESPEFIAFRDGQEWICVHCRGLCPAGSECLQNQFERTKHRKQLETVRFAWPHKFPDQPLSVLVVLRRRKKNGDFDDDPEEGISVSLTQSPCGMWSTVTKCRIGLYRASIKADGRWVASATFCVFSSYANAAESAQKNLKYRVRTRYFACQDRPRISALRRGPRVHWTVAENNSSGPVHAIRKNNSDNANKVIGECSRVEGYDWQRAKRHNVVHWRPVAQKADSLEVERGKSSFFRDDYKLHSFSSTQTVTLTCSTKDRSSWTRSGEALPRLRPGLSYEKLCNEWNTLKYDEMLRSLWGIVTGRSAIHGIGLFTLTGYQKGEFIIEYAGDLIRTPLADIREARYEAGGLGTYFFKINEQEIVDATVQSNRARFTNHSCDPNMIARIIHVRGRDLVALQATRDIPKYAELTFDYKLPIEDKKVQCLCNAWNCVGVIN
eukprot:gb/GEZJ01001977.1/.p1 GENE.gb/GEZJ01001977.1/~~gb/GEZJ01001977.1/.p1  ORF type:complete len:2092 (+),score=195.61 gb/GEZJ01001977.1/:551-6826(+)